MMNNLCKIFVYVGLVKLSSSNSVTMISDEVPFNWESQSAVAWAEKTDLSHGDGVGHDVDEDPVRVVQAQRRQGKTDDREAKIELSQKVIIQENMFEVNILKNSSLHNKPIRIK
jgi:hypothetical protein